MAEKVEHACKKRKNSPAKQLFASAPTSSDDDVLEFERGLNIYLVAIGGIAVAVMMLMLWKLNS